MSDLLRFASDDLARRLTHHHYCETDGEAKIWRMDPNGTAPLYHLKNSRRVSFSALDLAREGGLEPDPVCCASFLANGVYYGDCAFHPDLLALGPGEGLKVGPHGTELLQDELCRPWLQAIDGNSSDMIEAMLEAVEPLRGSKVLCDLTGGLDSRLVALILKRAGIPFTGCVGGAADSPDVLIAARVAEALDVELIHFPSERPDDIDTWREVLRESGACLTVRTAAFLREVGRRRSGFDISVGGLAGEMLRDFWWLQDPLGIESDSRPDWLRVVRYRMYQKPLPAHLLRGEWAEAYSEEPRRRAEWFAARTENLPIRRKRDILDFSCRRLHFPHWYRAYLSMSLNYIRLHNPFLHDSVLSLAFGTPARVHRLGRFIRSTISTLDRKIAAIPLDSGGNALELRPDRPWRYLPLYGHLAGSVMRRLPFHRRKVTPPVWAPRPLPCEELAARGIVDPKALRRYAEQPGSLATVERLVTLELLFQELRRND